MSLLQALVVLWAVSVVAVGEMFHRAIKDDRRFGEDELERLFSLAAAEPRSSEPADGHQ